MKTRTQHALEFIALALVFALAFGAGETLADGKVTTANADPVTVWKIDEVKFPGLADARNVAIIQAKFYRESGSVDHVTEISVSGDEYSSFLLAINKPSGADEADLTITNQDGTTSPDLSTIFRLRISRWIVTNGKLEGVTAEPVTTTSTQ